MSANINKWFNDLVHILTQQDMREAQKPGHNIYALSHRFHAAEEAKGEALDILQRHLMNERDAFTTAVMTNFHPAPFLRTFLRKLDSSIDVKRGNWIKTSSKCVCPR